MVVEGSDMDKGKGKGVRGNRRGRQKLGKGRRAVVKELEGRESI